MRYFITKTSFAICILSVVGYANAAEDKPKQGQPEAGLTVFIDPATGKVRRATQADIEKLVGPARAKAAIRQASRPEQLDVIHGPGGAVGVKLGAESRSYVVVTKTPGGKLSTDCVTGDEAAAKVVAGK